MAQHIAIVIVLRGFEQHHVEAANAPRTFRDLALIVGGGGMNGKQRHEPGYLSEKRCVLHLSTTQTTSGQQNRETIAYFR